jgi:putative sterol carrier protein
MARFGSTLRHAWNVFTNQESRSRTQPYTEYYGASYSTKPDRVRLRIPTGRTIISSIYTRIGIDVASVDMRHVRLDEEGRYSEDINSGLNNCLTLEANVDQAATQFRQDIALTLFDEGVVAIVPVDTDVNPYSSAGIDIRTMRVGKVVMWYPYHVRVSVFNEKTSIREEVTLPKSSVAIIENPLYMVMNEPNSTLQRLLQKLGQLDAVDEQSSSGKLDLIIQLPYVIKSEARRQQAEQRRKDIEFQLKGSQYGIAYTDGTEKITQLNRPAENNLMKQIEYLTAMLYGQLGITEEVMLGTADEKTMLNYWNRTIEPIVTAMVEAMRRSFLTKTARSQKQTVLFFRDPFRLIPIENIAEIADKFTRNEILSSNEIRGVIGFKPHTSPKADELVNSNMPQPDQASTDSIAATTAASEAEGDPRAEIDSVLAELEQLAA